MLITRLNPVFLMLVVLLTPLKSIALTEADEFVSKQGDIDDDYYVAGGEVDVRSVVMGDVIAAGGELKIGDEVQGDVLAAGGHITIRGRVADDIRSAGGQVKIDARVGDDLIVTGGSVDVSADSSIAGDARLAGAEVRMAGDIGNDLSVAAGDIRISGNVSGDADLSRAEIHITQTARIAGDLHYNSPRPAIIDPEAFIGGNVTHRQMDWEEPGASPGGLFFPLTLIVAGIVWFLLFPRFTLSTVNIMREDTGKSLLVGFVVLILIPIAAFIMMAIVLGLWVGLSLMFLYLLALLAGYLLACFFVADLGASLIKLDITSKGKRIVAFVLAIIVIALLSNIPLLGGLLLFILLLLGLGAGALQLQRSYQQDATS